MPSFTTKQDVSHAAKEMFDLVADVEQYPEFLPLCRSLEVRGRKELEDGRTVLVADMTVAYKLFKETFTSRVELIPHEFRIEVAYLDGPFQYLENSWSFKDVGPEGSEVGFYISYEFKSRTLSSLVGLMFDKAFRKFTTAFKERADQVYGA